MSKLYDVPFLACELGLQRASVLVLERDLKPDSPWKVKPLGWRGLNTLSIESLYRRGLLNKLFDPAERPTTVEKKPGFQSGGHFAGLALNATKLELDRWKYRLPGPALIPSPITLDRFESALIERAASLGVEILRGDGVTKVFAQDDDSVTVEAGENRFRGKWLVGCDGGRSVVRKAAGFDFVGTEAQFTGFAVKCDWDDPQKVKPGFHITKNGMYIHGGPAALYMTDFDGGAFDRSQEITQEHLQTVLDRISGDPEGPKITNIHLASAFTDRCKQAATYRKGRILLAGDAAHIHGPLGSQGLNLGLGDAMNLGWKLAATLRRASDSKESPTDMTLLDTYESERHPIGSWVLEWTRAQVAILQPDLYGAAIQSLIHDVINTTDGTNLFIDRHWGLSQRYKLGEGDMFAHPLVGSSAPEFELDDGSRLGSKLEEGKGLLLNFEDVNNLKELVVGTKFEAKVDHISIGARNTLGLRALLVRPDGIVAWVAEDHVTGDIEAAEAALERWFGS